jgi:heme exporter protein C
MAAAAGPPSQSHRVEGGDVRVAIACALGTALGAWGLYAAWHVAPIEAELKMSQKIFYFHAPLGMWTILMTIVAAFAGAAYLWRRRPGADLLSEALMEVGVLACGVVLATGMLWAKPAWGEWFPWGEPRVTLVLVLFLLGLAYRAVRSSVDEPERRARFSAVVAVMGALVGIFAYAAIHVWNTTHPRVITTRGIGLQEDMKRAFFVCVAAMGLLCWGLVESRYRLARLRWRAERFSHDVQERIEEGS